MRRLIAFAALALVACSDKPVLSSGGSLMGLFSAPSVKLRPYRVETLPNGLKIYFVRDESLPRVSIRALVKVGLRDEPAELGGLHSLTASLLDSGTTTRSAEQLSEAFNSLGTEFSASPSDDMSVFAASTVTPEAERMLELFADVLTHPAFAEKEIKRERDQYKSALRRRVDNPGGMAGREFDKYLFGDHPYGRDSLGTEESLAKIKRADLMRYYLGWYRPNNTLMVVTGRYAADFEKKVAATFSSWGRREIKSSPFPALQQVGKLSLRLVSKPGLVQTQIRFGRIGVERGNSDDLKLRLANEALGGGFGSRLMQKIRDDQGLTYSISSGFESAEKGGFFTISTFTKNETVGKTVEEVLKVYDAYAEKGITQSELDSAKAQMIGQYPRSLETADGMAYQLLLVDFYKLPMEYLTDFPKLVNAVSLKDVNQAIRAHLAPEGLKILVYGDRKFVAPQLKTWSPEIVDVK